MFRLPRTATAPFCPSEVRGSVMVSAATALWQRMLRMAGPGLLVSVGYMDPGSWAIEIIRQIYGPAGFRQPACR